MAATLLVWATAAAIALWSAAETTFGRVLFTLSRNHGVHVGDILAVAVAATGATVATMWLWGRGR